MIDRVRFIEGLRRAKLPQNEFSIVNSVWLSLMGIRANGDLDIVISKSLWKDRFNHIPENKSFGIAESGERRLRVHAQLGSYVELDSVVDTDDLVLNHSIEIEGFRVVEPKLYFLYKAKRSEHVRRQIENLPTWRALPLMAGPHKKLFKKRAKDVRDFEQLARYFSAGSHRTGPMAQFSTDIWGLGMTELAKYFSDC